MISRNELVAIINTAYDAVNASKAGPIFGEENPEDGQRPFMLLGYNTYLYAIQKLVPCAIEMSGEFTETNTKGEVVRNGDIAVGPGGHG